MKCSRILGLATSPLFASALALGWMACGDGNSGGGKSDTAVADTAPALQDAGVPNPDGWCPTAPTAVTAAGTAPMPAAGPAVPSTATRPQLAKAFAENEVTIKKVLAKGGLMTPPDAGSAALPPLPVDAPVATPDAPATDVATIDAPTAPDAATTEAGKSSDGGAPEVGTPITTAPALSPNFQFTDNWDPLTNGIGDVKTFKPLFVVHPEKGKGTHQTLNEALLATSAIAMSEVCSRIYIQVTPGTYREKADVPSKTSAPPVTVYSLEPDAAKTVIVFNANVPAHGSMSATWTMQVRAKTGFQMKNLTIQNDYVAGTGDGFDQSAVAMMVQTDRSQFENVRFLGQQSTLYIKSVDATTVSRSYFRDCYIEGDQDFIRGRGTAVFDHCEIKYKGTRLSTGRVIAYPSTALAAPFGFVFLGCNFTADPGVTDVALGHQWWEGKTEALLGKMIVRNSALGSHLAAQPWVAGGEGDRKATPKIPANGSTPIVVYSSDDYYTPGNGPAVPEPYLAEYGNTTK